MLLHSNTTIATVVMIACNKKIVTDFSSKERQEFVQKSNKVNSLEKKPKKSPTRKILSASIKVK